MPMHGKERYESLYKLLNQTNYYPKLEPISAVLGDHSNVAGAIVVFCHVCFCMVQLCRVIESTPAGFNADVGSLLPNRTVYICYKKGRDKPPITDIG